MFNDTHSKNIATSNLRHEEDGFLAIKQFDENGFILTNQSTYHSSISLFKHNVYEDLLPQKFEDISEHTIKTWLSFNPEIILLGTGITHLFLPQKLVSLCYEQHIGIETMKTDAACRTFRILAGEMRLALGLFITK